MSNNSAVCLCSCCTSETLDGRTLHRKTVLKHLATDKALVQNITGKTVSDETIANIQRCIELTSINLYDPKTTASVLGKFTTFGIQNAYTILILFILKTPQLMIPYTWNLTLKIRIWICQWTWIMI